MCPCVRASPLRVRAQPSSASQQADRGLSQPARVCIAETPLLAFACWQSWPKPAPHHAEADTRTSAAASGRSLRNFERSGLDKRVWRVSSRCQHDDKRSLPVPSHHPASLPSSNLRPPPPNSHPSQACTTTTQCVLCCIWRTVEDRSQAEAHRGQQEQQEQLQASFVVSEPSPTLF